MPQYVNVSPLGALDVPALGKTIEAGETFDVPDDLAEFFHDQAENFQPIAGPAISSGLVPGVDTGHTDPDTGFADANAEPAAEPVPDAGEPAPAAPPAAEAAPAGPSGPETPEAAASTDETPDKGATPKGGK